MRLAPYVSLGATAVLLSAAQSRSPSKGQASVAGKYSLLICRDGCGNWDTTRAYLTGTVVLFDSTLKDVNRKPIGVLYLGYANGCFRNRVLKKEFPSHAAIRLSGFFSWQQSSSGQVALRLFRSADAAYSVSVSLGPQGGTGTGTASMNGATDPHPDSVLLRRNGEADADFCATTGRTHRGPAMLKVTVVSEPTPLRCLARWLSSSHARRSQLARRTAAANSWSPASTRVSRDMASAPSLLAARATRP